MLDIDDALRRVERDADGDVSGDLDAVRDRLDELATDRATDREATLDDIENTLLAVEERVDGDAGRDARAARNRIEIYRNERAEGDEAPFVLDSELRTSEGAGSDVDVEATVVNEGPARAVRAALVFYDDDDEALEEAESDAARIDRDEQATIEFGATRPAHASYYVVTARPDGAR